MIMTQAPRRVIPKPQLQGRHGIEPTAMMSSSEVSYVIEDTKPRSPPLLSSEQPEDDHHASYLARALIGVELKPSQTSQTSSDPQ